MAEILIKAVDATHSNTDKDRRGCYKRGYPVVVMPDGHPWGFEEKLPKFVVIKVPLISVDKVQKYIEQWLDGSGGLLQRRRWQIRWADLPAAVRNKLASNGEIIIKAGAYSGTFDYTWSQVKGYFRNLETRLDETADL